jgi:hypothetical protein
MTVNENASVLVSRFKLSSALLGTANLLSGIISIKRWEPTSWEWMNFLMLVWGMGISLGFSILLLVHFLHLYQTRSENEDRKVGLIADHTH